MKNRLHDVNLIFSHRRDKGIEISFQHIVIKVAESKRVPRDKLITRGNGRGRKHSPATARATYSNFPA